MANSFAAQLADAQQLADALENSWPARLRHKFLIKPSNYIVQNCGAVMMMLNRSTSGT